MLDKAALEDNGRFDVVVVADLVERRIMRVLLKIEGSKQHVSLEQSERWVVRLFKIYISKCPENIKRNDVFYLTPIKNCKSASEVWYTKVPIGKNTMARNCGHGF
jgi:hypothetical protein